MNSLRKNKEENNLIMKQIYDLNLQELFLNSEDLTFLVGAGCSVDLPSCLPSGRKMMDAIIDYTCAKSEIENIRKLEDLRYEALVEIIRDNLDNNLKLIDYFGKCDTPNLQHFFLTEMIKKGNFVMTTNFDFLIEYALIQSGVEKSSIIPVITKDDFEMYKNPEKLFQDGKKAVYKIHGSTRNIITGQSTKESLIATLQAFGSNKEGENVFQLEYFKRPLFINIINGRSLIVMGYSGRDDFDIVPTLKVLKELKNIYWINYVHDDNENANIFEIQTNSDPSSGEYEKINQILIEIKRMNNVNHVYRIDVNTPRFVEKMNKDKHLFRGQNFNITPKDWLVSNIKPPNEIMKYQIPYQIYDNLDKIENALFCCEKILNLAIKEDKKYWKGKALNNIGKIYYLQGNYEDAIKSHNEALQIAESVNDLRMKATSLYHLGIIYQSRGDYKKAINLYKAALQIDEQLGDQKAKILRINNIGTIYYLEGDYEKTLEFFEEALHIDEELGDLDGKAADLNNIGTIFYAQRNHEKAMKLYKEALEIDELIGDLSGKSANLFNMASVYIAKGNYAKALDIAKESLEIDKKLNNTKSIGLKCPLMCDIYLEMNNKPEAIKYLKRAISIFNELGLENQLQNTQQFILERIEELGTDPEIFSLLNDL